MAISVDWYFDFVSPYSYLCLHRLKELPAQVSYKPVLFAGLLNHFEQKGPAEIASKRKWTYRWCHWSAAQLGIAFRFPASHPFNPLQHLRLSIACGNRPQAVKRIFESVWTDGAEATDPARFAALCTDLGIDQARLSDPDIKHSLREGTDEAAALGIFGVPTFAVDGELFWGVDAVGFVHAYLADPAALHNDEMRRLDALPVSAARKA